MMDKNVVIVCLTILAVLCVGMLVFVTETTITTQLLLIVSNIVSGLLGIATGTRLTQPKKKSNS